MDEKETLIKILDEVMEMLFFDIEKNNESNIILKKENYRRLYREYLNIKNDTKQKAENNL